MACDVTQEGDLVALVQQTTQRFGKLTILVSNAGGGGAIFAITSMAGENKNRRMASYGASKAAANHLIRNIAFDLGPMGIRVNGIAPGATRTAALESVLNDDIQGQWPDIDRVWRWCAGAGLTRIGLTFESEKPMSTNKLATALAATLVMAGAACAQPSNTLSAPASDAKAVGWMQGFPPAADKTIRLCKWMPRSTR